ncbi:MAG: hypothetical protein E6G62_11300 [Actinobacteria bacterium]|nr:MAG: hypothetical protein E6G62_11300 [Actinomycetota bacterium]
MGAGRSAAHRRGGPPRGGGGARRRRSGKLVRSSFEQSLLGWADKLGLKCTVAEHPHLLTTQVLFTCTGPKHKIDEFARALNAEGTATLRADGILMLNPL